MPAAKHDICWLGHWTPAGDICSAAFHPCAAYLCGPRPLRVGMNALTLPSSWAPRSHRGRSDGTRVHNIRRTRPHTELWMHIHHPPSLINNHTSHHTLTHITASVGLWSAHPPNTFVGSWLGASSQVALLQPAALPQIPLVILAESHSLVRYENWSRNSEKKSYQIRNKKKPRRLRSVKKKQRHLVAIVSANVEDFDHACAVSKIRKHIKAFPGWIGKTKGEHCFFLSTSHWWISSNPEGLSSSSLITSPTSVGVAADTTSVLLSISLIRLDLWPLVVMRGSA